MAGNRHIVFTHWPYRRDDDMSYELRQDLAFEAFSRLCEAVQTDSRCTYALVFCETGAESKPHVHGLVSFENPVMFSHLKKLFKDNGLHCEPLRGSVQDNLDYANREGVHKDKPGKALAPVFEWGVRPKIGAGRPSWSAGSSDYFDLVRALRLGKTDGELMDLYPLQYVRYFHNIQRLRELIHHQQLYIKEELVNDGA